MNLDASNNMYRRTSSGIRNNDSFRNVNDYHERFNHNQYYNAVEDEQIYMDEYTTLIHRYNDFITSGNAMFTRMEQTLRENLSRTLVRQSFYYNQFAELSQNTHIITRQNNERQRQEPMMDEPVVANPIQTSPLVAPVSVHPLHQREPNNAHSLQSNYRFGEVFPRLLSRYLSSDVNRNERQSNNVRENMFSMLYTVPVSLRTNRNNNISVDGEHHRNAPTNEQINRATLNTVFSHILSPVNTTCPISRDEFNDDSLITMIRGCNHIFNRESLRHWFSSNSTCPMCRNDIRDYRPSSLVSEPEQREIQENRNAHVDSDALSNISIDRIDDNHITFSYDIPVQYNDDDVYRNLLNTINNMAETSQQNNR